jgi:hypothetical protein
MKHLHNMAMKEKAITKGKTIKEWFEFLPQTIKAEAIYLAVDSNTYISDSKYSSLAEALVTAFPHDHTHAATDWTSYYLTLKEKEMYENRI